MFFKTVFPINLDPGSKQMPKLPDFPRSLPEGPILPSSLRFGGPGGPDSPSLPAGLLDRTPPMLDPLMLHRKLLSQKMGPGGLLSTPPNVSGIPTLGGAPTQSLYEMAALTHEMDTQAVTTKIKEILLANNVGQKVRNQVSQSISGFLVYSRYLQYLFKAYFNFISYDTF